MVRREVPPITPASTSRGLSTDLLKFSPAVDNRVDGLGQGLRYFHWVDTPKPTAMKPKPQTMFQLPMAPIGRLPSDT